MAEFDRITIEEIEIPSLVLMENAARGVFEVIMNEFSSARRILVVAGKGNNGGDGIAVGRLLYLKGKEVDIFLAGKEVKGDAQVQLSIAKKLGMNVFTEFPEKEYDLMIDAIFGTGFKPPVKGDLAKVIEKINSLNVPVVSIDIPSGLSADTGKVFEPFIKADITVTFQFPKICHVLFPASKYCGKVFIADISIPERLAESINREIISLKNLKLYKREIDTYKNREGHVFIVGGSEGKTGAVIMSALASSRAGAGLVTVGVPENLNPIIETNLIEEMSLPLKGVSRLSYFCVDKILEFQERADVLVIGMGMDRYEEGQDIMREILLKWEKPLVIDADGINNITDLGKEYLKKRKGITVLTPHVGEFSRLSGLSSKEIIANQFDVAVEFAKEYRVYLVLKSARTVIATPEGKAFISLRGTPAMAKGGSGDVLSGMIGALIPKMEVEEALKLAVYVHGLAGEIAEEKKHTESVKARDIIEAISEALTKLETSPFCLQRSLQYRLSFLSPLQCF